MPLISPGTPLYQLGYVPVDVPAAVNYWTKTIGVGPFFVIRHMPYDSVIYRGAPTDIDCSLYISYWGDVQIELVEQHNEAPSLYTEWLQSKAQGLHHVCYIVDDVAVARTKALELGGEIVQELRFSDGGGIYVDLGGGSGIVEILQPQPRAEAIFQKVQVHVANWNGSEPVREIGRLRS